ncbi:MAG: demethoxyubiquinone hydroxylase family protein [Pseudomonadota bacterium]|nr:demethoxyubiquinone hydroxylase family protein [Pseudomonadota bacterium]
MKEKFKDRIDEIIRVNHAGEYGAQRIYSGQIKFCKNKELKKKLEKIIREELVHYEYFNDVMIEKRTRPTLMNPLWHHGGFFLGALTSFLGEKYVHACTEAVEEVIVQHYEKQIKYLEKNKIEKKILRKIKQFCAEEENHRSYAENSNHKVTGVSIFKNLTKGLTKVVIEISKKI